MLGGSNSVAVQIAATVTPAARFDEAKLNAFMGKVVGDFGASASGILIAIGDKLGLYKAMAGAGALTPAELARKTGTHERYVREWLNGNAAGGYVTYDAVTGKYALPAEQALALADETSPAFIPGFYAVMEAMIRAQERIAASFRSGAGMAWGEHDHCLFEGTERFFRPGYIANLTNSWLPALDGAVAKLEAGIKVADVGCGLGASTIIMRRAVRGGQGRGQPEPGRPDLLRRVDHALRPVVAVRARTGAGRAGRRGAPARRRHRGRVLAVPPGDADAVQHGAGGATLTHLPCAHD
jgi:hypothetical protein